MNTDELYKALKKLREGIPGSSEAAGGFFAWIKFPAVKDETVRDIFKDFFFCQDDVNDGMVLSLVSNDGAPLIYEIKEVAHINAISYFAGLEKKFIFQCYRNFGLKLEIPKESVVNFIGKSKR